MSFPGFAGTIGGPLGGLIGPKGEFGSLSQSAIGAAFSLATQPFTHGASQLIAMASNRANPIQLPSYEQFLKLWHGGAIGDAALQSLAMLHGIRIAGGGIASLDTSPLWRLYNDKSRPVPPIELFRKWTRQGRIEPDAYYEAAQRHGLGTWVMNGCRGMPFRELIRTDYENLPAETLRANYLLDPTIEPEVRRRLLMLGYPPESIAMIFAAMRQVPGITEAINFRRRKLISQDQLDGMIFANGITSGADRANILEMVKAMPEPARLIDVAAGQLWDNERANRWGLDQEMPDQLALWSSRIGQDYGSSIDASDQSRYGGIPWHAMAWREHWKLPSIAVLAEWMHRFRGDPNDDTTWSEPGYRPMTKDEKADMWQAAGVPPNMRLHYERLLWQPLSIRHIRLVYGKEKVPELDAIGNIRRDANGDVIMGRHPRIWLQDKLMATGINDHDANSISRAMVQDAADRDALPGLKLRKHYDDKYVLQVQDAYRVGSATREQAQGQLTAKGIPDESARTITATIDLELYSGVIKAIAKRAKSDYLSGRTDVAGAHDRLTMGGVQQDRATLYVQAWAAEFGEGRRHLSTDRILRALRRGFITEQDALQRLDNLGWSRPDELIMLEEVAADIAKDNASQAKAESLAQKRQSDALQRLLDKNQKAKDKIIAGLRKTVPPATIMRWLREGIWSTAQAEARLKLLGFDDATIGGMIAEEQIKASGSGQTDIERAKKTANSLSKLFPPSKIEKWFKDGIWTEDQFRRMMARQGYSQDAIDGRVAEVRAHEKPPAKG